MLLLLSRRCKYVEISLFVFVVVFLQQMVSQSVHDSQQDPIYAAFLMRPRSTTVRPRFRLPAYIPRSYIHTYVVCPSVLCTTSILHSRASSVKYARSCLFVFIPFVCRFLIILLLFLRSVTGHVGLTPWDTNFFSDLQSSIPSDALEGTRTGGWRDELTLVNDEYVVTSTFSNVALIVKHDRLVIAEVLRLNLGENIVQIIKRLNGGWQCGWITAASRHSYDGETVIIKLLWVELNCICDYDELWLVAIFDR